jgi:prepilin-type processing-associated H-X9-DG protein
MNSATDHSRSSHPAPAAFTLVELLVILGTLAVAAALLTPALARTQPNSKALQCLNNHRQLCRAWRMFADDNNDRLLDSRSFVTGDVSTGPGSASELTSSPLNSYLGGNYKVYKCPADPKTTYSGVPTVRSVSMNSYIGQDPQGYQDLSYICYTNLSSMTRPGPANTFVILDESVNSINDGFFFVDMTGFDPYQPTTLAFVDVPAAFHNNAVSLSFADGHSEAHKWRDPRTAKAASYQGSPNNADVAWIQERTTRKLNNPTR